MTLELTLPWPEPSLWANRKAGRDWRVSQAAKVSARDAAYYLVAEALGGKRWLAIENADVPVRYVFHAPDGRAFDLNGGYSAIKPAEDGLAMALGINDRVFNPVTLARGEPAAGGCVIVRIGASGNGSARAAALEEAAQAAETWTPDPVRRERWDQADRHIAASIRLLKGLT